jgi:DNA-binding NarL/FixJ family response regulator
MGGFDTRHHPVQSSHHITVIIADDHTIVREGIADLLKDYFTVVGVAANGLEAVNLTETLHPMVLIVDLMMPMLNGLEVVTQLHKRAPTTKTIILSMNDDETQIVRAAKCGASGYVLKQAGSANLVQAIQAVALGKRYFTPSIDEERLQLLLHKPMPPSDDPYDTLTPREREILSFVVEGYTSQQIATLLIMSNRTVEVHRAHIMEKLGVDNTIALIRHVMKRNNP